MKKTLALFIVFVFGALVAQPANFNFSLGHPLNALITEADVEADKNPLEAPDESNPLTQQQLVEEEEEEKRIIVSAPAYKSLIYFSLKFPFNQNLYQEVPSGVLLPPPEHV